LDLCKFKPEAKFVNANPAYKHIPWLLYGDITDSSKNPQTEPEPKILKIYRSNQDFDVDIIEKELKELKILYEKLSNLYK